MRSSDTLVGSLPIQSSKWSCSYQQLVTTLPSKQTTGGNLRNQSLRIYCAYVHFTYVCIYISHMIIHIHTPEYLILLHMISPFFCFRKIASSASGKWPGVRAAQPNCQGSPEIQGYRARVSRVKAWITWKGLQKAPLMLGFCYLFEVISRRVWKSYKIIVNCNNAFQTLQLFMTL